MRKPTKILTISAIAAVLVTAAVLTTRFAGGPSPAPQAELPKPPAQDVMKELAKARGPSHIDEMVHAKNWEGLKAELAKTEKTDSVLSQLIRILDTEKIDAENNENLYKLVRDAVAAQPSHPQVTVLSTRLFARLGPTPQRLKELEKMFPTVAKREQADRLWMEVALAAERFPAKAGKSLNAILTSKNPGEVREGLYYVSLIKDPAAKKDFEGRVVKRYFRAPAAIQPYIYKEIFISFTNKPSEPEARKLREHARRQHSETWDDVRRFSP